MIPVMPQPEPPSFDADVRQKGKKWLSKKKAPLTGTKPKPKPKPKALALEPYWRACLPDLRKSYKGICAYLAVYLEEATGGESVDHFVPKSHDLSLAYEWSNYRFSSVRVNGRKGDATDILDPFHLPADLFHLEMVSGKIFVNPSCTDQSLRGRAEQTILRLGLDEEESRRMRTQYFDDYISKEITLTYLERRSPFVFAEILRQGLTW